MSRARWEGSGYPEREYPLRVDGRQRLVGGLWDLLVYEKGRHGDEVVTVPQAASPVISREAMDLLIKEEKGCMAQQRATEVGFEILKILEQ